MLKIDGEEEYAVSDEKVEVKAEDLRLRARRRTGSQDGAASTEGSTKP